MVVYKAKYKGKVVGVNGYGVVNTNKVKPETIKDLATRYPKLTMLIESKSNEKKTKTKKSN